MENIRLFAVISATDLLVDRTSSQSSDWPVFNMICRKEGTNGLPEVHRFEFQSKTERMDTVIEIAPIETPYGGFSRVGSYIRLWWWTLNGFDATDNSYYQDAIEEGVGFVPDSALVPL